MELKDKIKEASLEIAENHVIQAIDDVYKLAQVYVDDSASPLDNTLLEGLKMLKNNLIQAADAIDGKDNR